MPFASTSGGNPPMSVRGSIDLHITETGLSLSHADATAFVLSQVGSDEPKVAFVDVKNVRIRKGRFNSRYVLTVSYYKGGRHWWNTREIGKVILNESQYAQVTGALNTVSALKSRLDIA